MKFMTLTYLRFLYFFKISVVFSQQQNYTIKTLWNSHPINEDKYVELILSSTNGQEYLIIDIDAPFYRDPAPNGPPGPFAQLWNYEVVELFFLASSTNHYIELEFSPHGHYLVLLLIERRQVLKDLLLLPDFHVNNSESNRWTTTVLIPRKHFPANVDRFNAYAIHGQDAQRTYQALYPAPINSEKPDFHRLELFQSINFNELLNITDKDGDSWSNGASYSTTPLAAVIIIFCSMLFG